MRIKEIEEDCEDVSEYEDRAVEALENYCEQLQKKPDMIISLEEADKQELHYEDTWSFLWSDKATKLIEQEVKRLYQIGAKYYPNEDITIESYMYKEG